MRIEWVKQSDGSTNDITDFISTVSWSGSARQAARQLELPVLYSPYDKSISDPDIKPGDRLKLYDESKALIDVMVHNRERSSEQGTITYSGYDNLNYLLRSNVTHNFKNVTPEKVAEIVCNELQVGMGKIAITGVNIKTLLPQGEAAYNVIIKAYTKAHNANGKKYMPIMCGQKLFIIEKGEIVDGFTLNDKINITSSGYSETLDSMVNRVRIYDDKGKQIGEVKNSDWINAYGVFQDIYTKEDGANAVIAANSMLSGIEKTASIEAIGNVDCISGYGVKVKDTVTGLTGVFWIESDTHTWENGNHTMSLELAFKNIMDTEDD